MVDKHMATWVGQWRVVRSCTCVGALVCRAKTTCTSPVKPPGQEAVEPVVCMVVQPRHGVSHPCLENMAMHCRMPAHGICWRLYAVLGLQERQAVADVAVWLLLLRAEHAHGAVSCKVQSLLHARDALNTGTWRSCKCPSCSIPGASAACAGAAVTFQLCEPYVACYPCIPSQDQQAHKQQQGRPGCWPRDGLGRAARKTDTHPWQSTIGPSHAPAHGDEVHTISAHLHGDVNTSLCIEVNNGCSLALIVLGRWTAGQRVAQLTCSSPGCADARVADSGKL